MKVEIAWNKIDKEWWFDIGISYQTTSYYKSKRVITIALLFFSLYFRW